MSFSHFYDIQAANALSVWNEVWDGMAEFIRGIEFESFLKANRQLHWSKKRICFVISVFMWLTLSLKCLKTEMNWNEANGDVGAGADPAPSGSIKRHSFDTSVGARLDISQANMLQTTEGPSLYWRCKKAIRTERQTEIHLFFLICCCSSSFVFC